MTLDGGITYGLHPSSAGVAWLVTQINAILPNS